MINAWKLFRVSLLSIPLVATALLSAAPVTTFQIKGSIGQHVKLDVLDLDGSNTKVLFTDVNEADFDQGYIFVEKAIQLRGIQSNDPVVLKVKNNGWSLPSNYDVSAGHKTTTGADSELLLQADTGSLSMTAGNMATIAPIDSCFVAINDTPTEVLHLGTVGGNGAKSGVKGGEIDLDARILLDVVYDIPGDYEVMLEFTVAPQI
ncbi:MAG: hypothetical protein CMO81_05675 [Waddliaceae bacterium]|nr:hypothetical protein [Waddliaceae bacterium]